LSHGTPCPGIRRGRRLLRLAATGALLVLIAPAMAQAAPVPPATAVLSHPLPVPRQEIALTFDDGPGSAATAKILALLRSHGAHATFFVLGTELERYPGLAAEAAREGNELADHGMSHRAFPRLGAKRLLYELRTTADLILELTGRSPAFVRPPYGSVNQRVVQVARSLHMTVALWTLDTRDWQNPGAAAIARRVLEHVRPGEIVLMHDGGGPRPQTVEAVRMILAGLDARGYTAVTLGQLVRDARPVARTPARHAA